MFRLVERGGAGLCCDEEGLALGPVPLVTRGVDSGEQPHYRLRPDDEIVEALRWAYDGLDKEIIVSRVAGIERIAKALEIGDHVHARIVAVQLGFPDIPSVGMDKLRRFPPHLRKYSPDQPRVPAGSPAGGQWAGAGASYESASPLALENQIPSNSVAAKPIESVKPDSGGEAISPPDEKKYVTLNDGTVPQDHLGNPLRIPPGVSLEDNARLGQAIAQMGDDPSLEYGEIAKDGAMVGLFAPRIGKMDYQWIFGSNGKYNKDYIDFGNYNYGVVAAAAGYTMDEAVRAAGFVNQFGQGDKSGPLGNNPRNLEMIRKGFCDYKAGKIIPLGQKP